MKLKEKFKQWFINDEEDEHYEGIVELVSIEHEKIADDFAIGFAEWCGLRTVQITESEWANWLPNANDTLSTKELLQIYKKEKQL